MSGLYHSLKDVQKVTTLFAPKLPPVVPSSSADKTTPVVRTSARPSTQPVKPTTTVAPKPTTKASASTAPPPIKTTPSPKVVLSSSSSPSSSSHPSSASTQSTSSSLPSTYTSISFTTVLPTQSLSTQSLSLNNAVTSMSTPSSSSSSASIVGPVVGSIVCIAILGTLAFFIIRRRRQLREQSYLDNFIEENDGSTMSPNSMSAARNLNTNVWGISPAAVNDPSKRFSHQRFPPASPQIQYVDAQYQNLAEPQQKRLPPLPPSALQQQAYGPASSSPHLGANNRPLSVNFSYANAGQGLTAPLPAAISTAAGGAHMGATLAPGQRVGDDRPRLASFAFSDQPLFELGDDGGSDFSGASDQALQQAAAPVGLAPRVQPHLYQRSPRMRASQMLYGQPWQYQQQGYPQQQQGYPQQQQGYPQQQQGYPQQQQGYPQQQSGYNPQSYYAPRHYQPMPYGAPQQSMQYPQPPVAQYDNEQDEEAMQFPVPPARVDGAISPIPAMDEAAEASVSDNVARNPLPPLRDDNVTSVQSEPIETLGAMTMAAAVALEMEAQDGNVEESQRVSPGSRSEQASREIVANQEASEQERRTPAERNVEDLAVPRESAPQESARDNMVSLDLLNQNQGQSRNDLKEVERKEDGKDEKYEEEEKGQQEGYYGEQQQQQQEGYYEQQQQQEGYYDEQEQQQEEYYDEQPQYENAYKDEKHDHARETLYGLGDTYYNSGVPSGYESVIEGYESEVPPLPEGGASLEKNEHQHEEEGQGRERYDSGVPSRYASGVTGYASGVTGYESGVTPAWRHESSVDPYGGFSSEVDEEVIGKAQ